QLFGQVDVGVFQRAGDQLAKGTLTRYADQHLTGLGSFLPGGTIDAAQAARIDEVGQGHLALQHALAVAVVGVDHAVLLHRQAGLLTGGIAGGTVAGHHEVRAVLAGVGVVDGHVHRIDAHQVEADGYRRCRRIQGSTGGEGDGLRATARGDVHAVGVVVGDPLVGRGLDEILGQGVFLALRVEDLGGVGGVVGVHVGR